MISASGEGWRVSKLSMSGGLFIILLIERDPNLIFSNDHQRKDLEIWDFAVYTPQNPKSPKFSSARSISGDFVSLQFFIDPIDVILGF